MIALCFCKFALIYYFIYMNFLCSPSMGQSLVASIEVSCHVLSILDKSPSQTQMLWTCCVLKRSYTEESGYRGACRYTRTQAVFHCFKALWLTATMPCDESQWWRTGWKIRQWFKPLIHKVSPISPRRPVGWECTSEVFKGGSSACPWNFLPLLSTIWVF